MGAWGTLPTIPARSWALARVATSINIIMMLPINRFLRRFMIFLVLVVRCDRPGQHIATIYRRQRRYGRTRPGTIRGTKRGTARTQGRSWLHALALLGLINLA